jgi:hypothetical protein
MIFVDALKFPSFLHLEVDKMQLKDSETNLIIVEQKDNHYCLLIVLIVTHDGLQEFVTENPFFK